jgi:hypothetical protein
MVFTCDECGKLLTTKFSLTRHLKLIHEDNTKEDENDTSSENLKTEESEEESQSEASNDSSDSIVVGWKNEFWRCILEKAYKSVKNLPDDINKMMDAPHFTELKSRLHSLYKI